MQLVVCRGEWRDILPDVCTSAEYTQWACSNHHKTTLYTRLHTLLQVLKLHVHNAQKCAQFYLFLVAFFTRATLCSRYSAVLAIVPCLQVSVCHKSVLRRNGRTNRASFWHKSSIYNLSCTVLKGNSSISKIRALPFGTLSQTPNKKILLRHVLSTRWTLRAW